MTKSSFVLLIALILGASTPSSSDLIDEANGQYFELRDIVEGKIAAASTEFSAMTTDVSTYGQNVYNQGILTISAIHEKSLVRCALIKEAAQSAGVDITRCAEGPEETIDSLPNKANLEMELCINSWIEGASNVVSATVSRVNGLTSRVHDFRFRIASCNGNFLCVAPILQDIELAKIKIPQEIDTEVLQSTEWMVDIKISIPECSNNAISYYINMMSTQIDEIAKCLE